MTTSEIQRQMNRLSILREFPEKPESIKVLADTLKKLCRNENELHRLVTAWCEHSEYSPTEAGLRTVLSEIRAAEVPETDFKAAKCRLCGGTGYSPAWWLETIERRGESNHKSSQWITKPQYDELRRKLATDATWTQQVYSGVTYCQCSDGRNIVAAQYAREAEDHMKGSKHL